MKHGGGRHPLRHHKPRASSPGINLTLILQSSIAQKPLYLCGSIVFIFCYKQWHAIAMPAGDWVVPFAVQINQLLQYKNLKS